MRLWINVHHAIYHLAVVQVNNWVAAGVIGCCLAVAVAYAVVSEGLPIYCFKQNQKEYLAPGGGMKAVSYTYNCRSMIFGIDFGQAWKAPSTGIEILSRNSIIGETGMPPALMVAYNRDLLDVNSKITSAPRVLIEWKNARDILIRHSRQSHNVYEFPYYQEFRIGYVADLD